MNDKRMVLEEMVRRYSHRMPYPEKALSLMTLRAQDSPMPASEWELLSLSLLASTSEPLFLFLRSHPEKMGEFLELTHDRKLLGFGPMKESLLREIIASASSPASVMGDFRLVRLASILVLDILSIISFDETTLALTHLSDAIAWTAVYLSEHKAVDEMGNPYHRSGDRKPVPTKSAFFALGKWGAEELNYSSDIDLVAFYYREGSTDRGFSNQQFFDGVARSAFELLSSRDLAGGGFRVDFGLRPRGQDGSLTLPFPAALDYYRDNARPWEKQAWIKARQFYGDPAAGDEFLKELQPAAFSEQTGPGVAEGIKSSRKQTISGLREPGRDLKKGRGSIRDIEFAVQGLQIIRLRGKEALHERHTLRALHKLKENGIITPAEGSEVSSSYKTLRKAEHFAQVLNLRQSHLEPSSEKEWKALDRFLGVNDSRIAVRESRETAGRFFDEAMKNLSREGSPLLSEDHLKDELSKRGFDGPEKLAPLLLNIYRKLGRAEIGPVHELLLKVLPDIPGRERALGPILSLLPEASSGQEPELFEEGRLRTLFKIVSSSGVLAEYLCSFPKMASLADEEALKGLDIARSAAELSGAGIDDCRTAQKELFFRLIAKEIISGDEHFLSNYTGIAETILRRCFEEAVMGAAEEFRVSKEELLSNTGLFALGRMGFKEMVYGSDLDLVIMKEGERLIRQAPDISYLLERRIVSSLVEELTAITPRGSLYQVDLRLRPYGSAGAALPSRQAVLDYFSRSARPWEKLTYIKLRPVHPTPGRNGMPAVPGLAGNEPGGNDLAGIREMIRRLHGRNGTLEGALKFKEGGLFEQDLLILGKALCLRRPLPAGEGFEGLASFLQDEKAFSAGEISMLKEARLFFLRALYRLRINGLKGKKAKSPRELNWGAWDENEEASFRKEVSLLIESHFPSPA